jgi:hypothetical protein
LVLILGVPKVNDIDWNIRNDGKPAFISAIANKEKNHFRISNSL